MTHEKRSTPADAAVVPDAQNPNDEEVGSEFFDDGEHDGWSPIVKRRTPPPDAPPDAPPDPA